MRNAEANLAEAIGQRQSLSLARLGARAVICMQTRIQSIQVPEGLVQDFMYASCMLCMLEKMGTFKGGGGLRAGRTAAPDSGARAPGCLSQMRGSWFNAKKERKQKQAWCAIGPPAAAEAPASFSGLRCDQSTWNYPLAMPWAAATAAALTAADIALDESREGRRGIQSIQDEKLKRW